MRKATIKYSWMGEQIGLMFLECKFGNIASKVLHVNALKLLHLVESMLRKSDGLFVRKTPIIIVF